MARSVGSHKRSYGGGSFGSNFGGYSGSSFGGSLFDGSGMSFYDYDYGDYDSEYGEPPSFEDSFLIITLKMVNVRIPTKAWPILMDIRVQKMIVTPLFHRVKYLP